MTTNTVIAGLPWHEACQMFIGDHATEETPWLLDSCLARLREEDVLTWHRLLVLATMLVLKIIPPFPLSQFFPIVMRIRSLNCCSWQTTHCLLRSQKWRLRLVMSTLLAPYPSHPMPLPSPEPCNTMATAQLCSPFPLYFTKLAPIMC